MGLLTILTVLFITIVGCLFAADLTPNSTVSMGCSETQERNITAYFGWPSILSFEDAVTHIRRFNMIRFMELEKATAFCIVRLPSTGHVLQNVSLAFRPAFSSSDANDCAYRLPDVSVDTPTMYIVEYKVDNLCGFQKVHIIKEKQPVVDQNCSSAVSSLKYAAIKGTMRTLTCGNTRKLDFLTGAANITYKWIYNCDKEVNTSFRREGNQLFLEKIKFSFMGQYMCIVQYRGQRLPAVKYDVCVKHDPILYTNVEPKCIVPKAQMGGDVTITCEAAVGKTKARFVYTRWYKGGIEICKDPPLGATFSGKYRCLRRSSLDHVPCYDKLPIGEAQVDFYAVNLTIKNVIRSDFGQYQLDFKWGAGKKTRINVTLEEDITVLLENQIIGISVGTVFAFLIILFLLFCLCWKNDVAWFVKKHLGPYETELHSYAAYFVYYYDSTDKASDEMTTMKKLVEGLHEFMNKFGGTVYDEQRDPNIVAGDAENIKLIAGDCHRIIVMLSPGFVKDKWSQYKTNTALTEAVESGRKMIFITIPGTKDAIQNLSNEPRKTLQSAMKRNVTAQWNGKIPFNGSFRRRMEYGLPKLQKPDYLRCLSDSSQIPLTQNKQKKSYNAGASTPRSDDCDFVA